MRNRFRKNLTPTIIASAKCIMDPLGPFIYSETRYLIDVQRRWRIM